MPIRSILKKSEDLTRAVRGVQSFIWKRRRIGPINRYLASNHFRKLHVGCGSNLLPGWLNTDFYPGAGRIHLDASERYPFPKGSFHYIFSEHTIEHIDYRDAVNMLREWFHILKPEGRIRVATPDLRAYVDLLRDDLSPIQRDCVRHFYNDWIRAGFHSAKRYLPVTNEPSAAFVLNDLFWNYDHRFIYDFNSLADIVAAAGFTSIQRLPPGESADTTFRGLETHTDCVNSHITLVLEANK